jgi:periplasmic copper chaperone A
VKARLAALLAAGLYWGAALAQVSVSGAWIRATVPHQASAGVFMQLRAAADARLVEVRTPIAARAEIHRMQMQGQTMTMRAVPAIELRAGQELNLASGGYHVMLFGLKHQLRDGDIVPLTLVLETAGHQRATVDLKVAVKPLTYTAPAGR